MDPSPTTADPNLAGPAPSEARDGLAHSFSWDRTSLPAILLEATAQPFAMFDPHGLILRVNHAYSALTGYEAHELIGRNVLDLTAPGSQRDTIEELTALRETGRGCRFEKQYRRKDGREIPVEVIADVYRDESGTILGVFSFVSDVSERTRAERALRASEAGFRRLYDEAPIGFDEVDARGVLVNINRTECEMLGYDRSEMLGRRVEDFLIDSEREGAAEAIAAMIRGDLTPGPAERTYQTKDGRRLVLSVENRQWLDSRGRVLGLRRTVRDVTDRREAETALVASVRQARELFEALGDAVFVHDLDGRILDANPAACQALGYTRSELLALGIRDIDAEGFAKGFADRLGQQIQHGSLAFEGLHRAKSGRLIPVEITTSTLEFGGRMAILASIRDISERKALEETRKTLDEANRRNAEEIEAKNRELTLSEARSRSLTEGGLDAVIVADDRGVLTLFNPAAERTFGYSAAEVLGQPITVLMPEEYRSAHSHGFARYLQTRDPRVVGRTVELHGRRKDGTTFPLELSLSAVDVAGELQFIGSIRDQGERQRMRAMLAQSEKLASIGLLSAGVAHEINNPLAYVANNLAVLERDLKGVLDLIAGYESARDSLAECAPEVLVRVDAVAEELDWSYVRDNLGRLLTRTRDGVQRVANIVANLRGLARTTPPKMEEVAVGDVLGAALEMLQGRLRRSGIELEIDVPDDLPKLRCVAAQIGQVVLNLMVNALQAIETSERPDGIGGRLRIGSRSTAEHHAIEVQDNGPGIPEEDLPRLFDPFFTTKPVGEGTGLGLSISHGIVAGHGGRIEVDSQVGHGTCFRILLPRGTAVAASPGPPASEAASP